MNILLIHQYFHEKEVIGSSRFNEMVLEWVAQGHKVTVLAGMIHYSVATKKHEKYKGKYLVREKYSENVEVIRCHISESYNKNFLGRLWGYFSFVFYGTIGGLFKAKGKYNLVLVTSPPLFVGITGYILSRIKRLPFVFEVRDLWPESAIDTGVLTNKTIIRFAYFFEKFIYKKASLINVLTPAFRETLITKKGIPKDKIVFIPNAADFRVAENVAKSVDSEKFRRELGWSDKFVVLYVGAHGVANHLIQIVETAELMKNNKSILFACVGDGMQKAMLVQEAKERGLNNIKFYDPVPKQRIFEYVLAADVGASVLKKVDTFKTIYSNKTFDYMSCKKPILMVIDGVSRELVETSKCGVFVEPENPEDFAKNVLYLYNNKEMLPEFGLNGYNYAKKHFDRTKLASKYLEHLKGVAK